MQRLEFLLIGVVLMPHSTLAATIHVPGDQPTIQAGINVAQEDDVVLVAAGDYSGPGNREITFGGKDLVVTSEEGPKQTRILPGGECAFHVAGSEGPVIRGFTIESGRQAIYCEPLTSPTVEDCRLLRCIGSSAGAAMVSSEETVVRRCLFQYNLAYFEQGGAVYGSGVFEECMFISNGGFKNYEGGAIFGWDLTIAGCQFIDNGAGGFKFDLFGEGGALYISGNNTITDCSFVGNVADQVGGAIKISNDEGTTIIERCLFHDNRAGGGGAIASPQALFVRESTFSANESETLGGAFIGATATFERTIVWGNCAVGEGDEMFGGNITFICSATDSSGLAGGSFIFEGDQVFEDPIFCGPAPCGSPGGDYTLSAASPCTPESSPCGRLIGALGVGCVPPTVVERGTWGWIKAPFRR